eukprot:7941739-Pyramimonas_sp.AAC.1
MLDRGAASDRRVPRRVVSRGPRRTGRDFSQPRQGAPRGVRRCVVPSADQEAAAPDDGLRRPA